MDGMFQRQHQRPGPDLIYKDPGPPTVPAQYGTRIQDQNGILWTQAGDGYAQYWVQSGVAHSRTGIQWSNGTWPVTSFTGTASGDIPGQAYNIGGTGAFDATNNTDYLTAFYLDKPMKVYGLIIPVVLAVASTTIVKVKASIYKTAPKNNTGWPWKIVDSRAKFSTPATGILVQSTGDFLMIPYATTGQEFVTLYPDKYYIRHMWGGRCTANFAIRALWEAVTGTNFYRADRYRPTGSSLNYDTTTMDDTLTIGSAPGSQAAAGLERLQWGMWGEIWD